MKNNYSLEQLLEMKGTITDALRDSNNWAKAIFDLTDLVVVSYNAGRADALHNTAELADYYTRQAKIHADRIQSKGE